MRGGSGTPSRLAAALLAAVAAALGAADGTAAAQTAAPEVSSCVACHAGIEPMHPEADLSCADCHGGDPTAPRKVDAHVSPSAALPGDERVPALDADLAWRRFRNPMDLRVADRTCGSCHEDALEHLRSSLHGTTAGHLSDGWYEMGLAEERGSRWGVFPVPRASEPGGEVESLAQVPGFQDWRPRDELATHFTDLPRKECMQCHLWSEGRAVRGRVGFDGEYRGQGCAACHVPYALDGLSRSADVHAPRREPGHPSAHTLTAAPTTQTCATCHFGDASIGLHFRGLSQLPPGAPGGPDIPGTTDSPLNRVYYVDDPALTPPDVHHEKGMHCIDCHTAADVMGDGRLHGQMEHAVEIECTDCHGTFYERAALRTERGTPLEHLRREGEAVVLTSKVDGALHEVPQVVDVLDPEHPRYNPRAAEAMTPRHGRLECYTCHAGWNVNFLGFHFDRNESLTQLDLLSGRRTPGRVTTQEKVFATWKSFFAGLNDEGHVAPYLTGFSTMGSVRDEQGELVLDQELPVTAAGLSGLTMIHHQLHATRPTARSCVECHRSSATWGMGSVNFRLARRLAFVADRRGIEVVAVERGQLGASTPLAKVVLPDVVALELDCDPLQGRARTVFAAEGGRGIHALDVRDPAHPRRTDFIATLNPRGMQLAGDHLYLADGVGGLRVFDVSDPTDLRQVAVLPTIDAHDVHVQWPWAYVADGAGGLAIVDVRAPIAPRYLAGLDLDPQGAEPDAAIAVSSLFQYSRPTARGGKPSDVRTEARHLCVVLDRKRGPVLVDVTQADRPAILWPPADDVSRARASERFSYRGLVLASHVDLAEAQGGTPTGESDYAYVLRERVGGNGARTSRLEVWDVGNPQRARIVGTAPAGGATEMLSMAAWYNPPFLQTVLLAPGSEGAWALDASISREPRQVGIFPAIGRAWVVAVEEFPLDRMLDADGRLLKDVSHAGSRWLHRAEIERLLDVPAADLGLDAGAERPAPPPGLTARLFLERLDEDGSGAIEAREITSSGVRAFDLDGDERVALHELAGIAGLLEPEPGEAQPMAVASIYERADAEGDLARLLDGVDPWAHDADGSGTLDRRELTRAFFTALDLDASGRLTLDELSRAPGPLRRLRHRDAAARRAFDEVDLNGDGTVGPGELRLRELDWLALDVDRDGAIELPADVPEWMRARGFAGRLSEWPERRMAVTGLPPIVELETVLAALDTDGDERLSRKELRRRPLLFAELDGDEDGSVSREELQARVDLATRLGVGGSAETFEARWDLDGDGKIEPGELAPGARRALEDDAHAP